LIHSAHGDANWGVFGPKPVREPRTGVCAGGEKSKAKPIV